MARKSLLAPTLFTVFGLAVLLGLGTWQLERLRSKEALIAAREAAMTGAPAALPATLAAARAREYHRVAAVGRFLNERELYLHATASDGTPGWHVLTPFALADGTALLIDRGFVPDANKPPATRAAAAAAEPQSVTGVLRLAADGRSWFVPDNRPDRNEWFYIDLPAMAAAARLERPLPFYLDADPLPDPRLYPRGGQTPVNLPNDHLQYAITWYTLAAALLVIYILLVRRGRRAGEQT